MIVKLRPPLTLIAAIRAGFPAGFGETLKTTVPLPVPLAPLVITTHAAFDEAVQPHAGAVRTAKLHAPPGKAGNSCEALAPSLYTHGGPAA